MCLTTREKHCEIAEKPITCYKTVFTRLQDAKSGDMQIFKSEFYYFVYRIGEEYALGPEANASFPCENPERADDKSSYRLNGKQYLRVRAGFHSFSELDYAKEFCDDFDSDTVEMFTSGRLRSINFEVVLKCEIPAGARYWKGNCDGGNESGGNRFEYCSDRIRVVAWKFAGERNWRKKTLEFKRETEKALG